jgi:hypothetical protein
MTSRACATPSDSVEIRGTPTTLAVMAPSPPSKKWLRNSYLVWEERETTVLGPEGGQSFIQRVEVEHMTDWMTMDEAAAWHSRIRADPNFIGVQQTYFK